MTEETTIKYDFAGIEDCIKTIDSLYEKYETKFKIPKEHLDALNNTLDGFFRTRTNSEILDMPDIDCGDDTSIYDYDEWIMERYYAEIERRNWVITNAQRDTYIEVGLGEYRHSKDNTILDRLTKLEEQTTGMQKKIDKIVQLLEGFSITMTVKDALKL